MLVRVGGLRWTTRMKPAPTTPLNYKRSSLLTSSRPPSGALPSFGKDSHLGAPSPVTVAGGEEGAMTVRRLLDPRDRGVPLAYSGGRLLSVTLSSVSSPLVCSTLAAAKLLLPRELGLALQLAWYSTRHGPGQPPSMGEAAPSKKCQPSEAGFDADWQFLLSSAHHTEVDCSVSRLLDLAQPLQDNSTHQSEAGPGGEVSWSAPLFPFIPALLYKELKLDLGQADQLGRLAGFLSRFAADLQLPHYQELPHATLTPHTPWASQLAPALLSRLSPAPLITSKPPSVVHHLTQLACKQEVEPLPLLPGLALSNQTVALCLAALSSLPPEAALYALPQPGGPPVLLPPSLNSCPPNHRVAVLMTRVGWDTTRVSCLPPALALPLLASQAECQHDPDSRPLMVSLSQLLDLPDRCHLTHGFFATSVFFKSMPYKVCLKELAGPRLENCVDRKSYGLTAGLALGTITMGRGKALVTGKLAGLRLPEVLQNYMVDGPHTSRERLASYQIKVGDSINIDVRSPGLTLALGILYWRSNNAAVVSWMDSPDTSFMLGFVRPDLLLLRTLGLVLWDSATPSPAWLGRQAVERPEVSEEAGVEQSLAGLVAAAVVAVLAAATVQITVRAADQDDTLPPGYTREAAEGRNGRIRRYIVCPLQGNERQEKKFEKFSDLRMYQKEKKLHLELNAHHFKVYPIARRQEPIPVRSKSPVETTTRSKLDKRRDQLKKFEASVDRGLQPGEVPNHSQILADVAVKLHNFRNTVMKKDQTFMKIYEELRKTRTSEDNPLNNWPEDSTTNTRAELVLYAMEEMPYCLSLFLLTSTDLGKLPTTKQVLNIGGQLSSLHVLSCATRKHANALVKSQTVVAKTCGITYQGLDYLQKSSGATFGHSTAAQLRTEMAVLAGVYYRKLAGQFGLMAELDNYNIKNSQGSYNFTALALNFQEDRFFELADDDDMSLEEATACIDREHLLLDSDYNRELMQHYKEVVINVTARVIGDKFVKYEPIKRMFPKLYLHPNKEFAAKKDIQYLCKLLPFDENITDQMIKILEQVQDIYLDAVCRSSRDQEKFRSAIKRVKEKEATPQDRRAADDYMWEEARKYGWLVLRGDLLTEERVRGAKTARRKSSTRYSQLAYARETTLGYMHCSMNKIIIDFQSTLGGEFGADPASMAAFKTRLDWTVSHGRGNERKNITNSYEKHVQVIENVGRAAICEAWRSFSEDLAMPCPDQKEDAKTLIAKFLDDKKIYYLYDTKKDYSKEMFYDDLERNICDLAARGLVELVLDRVQKNSDGTGLRACSLALLPYFLNRTGEDINSKYAAHILFNNIDYMRCDTRTKARKDRYSSVNNTGVEGCNKPCDTSMENFIEDSKSIVKAQQARLDPLQVNKSIQGLNLAQYLKEQQLMMVEMPVRKPEHASSKVSLEDISVVEKMIHDAKPFDVTRDKVEYVDALHSIYDSADLSERIDHFLDMKRDCYRRDRNNQPF